MALAWNAGWVNSPQGSNPYPPHSGRGGGLLITSIAAPRPTEPRRSMGRTVAVTWHASFSLVAAGLYFFFVVPRWPELMGQTSPTLGLVLRIVTAVLIGLAALPVVFTLLRTKRPEYATRTWRCGCAPPRSSCTFWPLCSSSAPRSARSGSTSTTPASGCSASTALRPRSRCSASSASTWRSSPNCPHLHPNRSRLARRRAGAPQAVR